MSFRKIQRINPWIIDNPDSGHVYLGQDSIGLWEKDEWGNIWYIQSGNTYITVITGSTSSGTSGMVGTDGTSGRDGTSGVDGTSGKSGVSGTAGTSGIGSSGTSGKTGSSGSSGKTGTSGTSAVGTSGSSGVDGNFYGSSGTSGYSGGYGGATRVWIYENTENPPDGRFWAGNDSYPGDTSLALVNKIILNTKDADGVYEDNWLDTWKTGILKIELRNNASVFGIYELVEASNTKPTILLNLISGFTNQSSFGDLVDGEHYYISFVRSGIDSQGIIQILRGQGIYHRQTMGVDTVGDWRQWSDGSGFYVDYCSSINPTVWTNKDTITP